jgi:penicillin-insensitive murein endopeptidase
MCSWSRFTALLKRHPLPAALIVHCYTFAKHPLMLSSQVMAALPSVPRHDPFFCSTRGAGAVQIELMRRFATSLVVVLLFAASGAAAQDKGTLEPQPFPPLANPDDPKTPAKQLFGRKVMPTTGPSHVVGFYASGCLAGAAALPINGPAWQVMRLSRNRNWGHPELIRFLEGLGTKVAKAGTWSGLLVGDMSQPRGGPMITGHASHQVGLDADIWLTPMPPRKLSLAELEEMSATMVVADDRRDVDPKVWTPGHFAVIKAAASDPLVQRIFVNHFHVRLRCPGDSPECKPQPPAGGGDGCGKELNSWFTETVLHPKPSSVPEKPRPGKPMSSLPPACRQVLAAPNSHAEGATLDSRRSISPR